MKDFLQIRTIEEKVGIQNTEITAFRSKDLVKSGARAFLDNGRVTSSAHVGQTSQTVLFENCAMNQDVAIAGAVRPKTATKKHWNLSKQFQHKQTALTGANESSAIIARELPNVSVQGHVIVGTNETQYTSSEGADLKLNLDEYSFQFEIRQKGSPNIVDDFWYGTSLSGFCPEEELKWVIELFKSYEKKAEIKSGLQKVLMIPDESALKKIGESLRADLYSEGSALYSGKRGKQLFSNKFSLLDLRFAPERGTVKPFDFEGEVTTSLNRPLVESGVITGFISDLRNELRYGIDSTANGFRSYNSSVQLDFSALRLAPGLRSFRDILKDAGDVIVSEIAFGGDLTATGDFSTPIQLAFLVRNGVPVGRLPPLLMSSHLEKMFGSQLLEVANGGPYKSSTQPYLLSEMEIQEM